MTQANDNEIYDRVCLGYTDPAGPACPVHGYDRVPIFQVRQKHFDEEFMDGWVANFSIPRAVNYEAVYERLNSLLKSPEQRECNCESCTNELRNMKRFAYVNTLCRHPVAPWDNHVWYHQ